MDNFKTHEEKSLPSSNPKRLRLISYFPCTTSKRFKKTIYEGIERNSQEDQVLVDIFYDAEENVPIFDENFENESSSSQLKQSYCAICTDNKPIEEMFETRKCSHSFCKDCVGSYLAKQIQENIAMVKCPDSKCNDILEPYDCISIIPKDVFERWENALVLLGSQIFYCPFNDCSAMLVNEGEDVVTVSECPNCDRLFCAQCKVSWHAGVDCREFRSLKLADRETEDLMAMGLAKNKNWKRCHKSKSCSLLPYIIQMLSLCFLWWITWSLGYSSVGTSIIILLLSIIYFVLNLMFNF